MSRDLLLSPQPIEAYSPDEFRAYLRTLYEAPAVRVEAKELTCRLTATGKFSCRTSRKPKWISRREIDACASETKCDLRSVWNYFIRAKYRIVRDSVAGLQYAESTKQVRQV